CRRARGLASASSRNARIVSPAVLRSWPLVGGAVAAAPFMARPRTSMAPSSGMGNGDAAALSGDSDGAGRTAMEATSWKNVEWIDEALAGNVHRIGAEC